MSENSLRLSASGRAWKTARAWRSASRGSATSSWATSVVARLPGCDREPEHLEDPADVPLGRGRVDALTFGDAPNELPAVEALGRLGRRGQPGTHLGRQERGDVLRLAAADPF